MEWSIVRYLLGYIMYSYRSLTFASLWQVGRIMVLPVEEPRKEPRQPLPEDYQPLMLLALNATDAVGWDELQSKVRCPSTCLSCAHNGFRDGYWLAIWLDRWESSVNI